MEKLPDGSIAFSTAVTVTFTAPDPQAAHRVIGLLRGSADAVDASVTITDQETGMDVTETFMKSVYQAAAAPPPRTGTPMPEPTKPTTYGPDHIKVRATHDRHTVEEVLSMLLEDHLDDFEELTREARTTDGHAPERLRYERLVAELMDRLTARGSTTAPLAVGDAAATPRRSLGRGGSKKEG